MAWMAVIVTLLRRAHSAKEREREREEGGREGEREGGGLTLVDMSILRINFLILPFAT